MGKRPRIFNSPAERAKRIKANFDFYDGIKKAISDHDELNNDFKDSLLNDKK